jgi:epoxyqueuosine reductase
VNPSLQWLAELDESQFEQLFNGSPIRRAGYQGLRRNTAIAMGNSGLAHFLPLLNQWAMAADQGLRSAAQWAVAKLQSEATPPNPSD